MSLKPAHALVLALVFALELIFPSQWFIIFDEKNQQLPETYQQTALVSLCHPVFTLSDLFSK